MKYKIINPLGETPAQIRFMEACCDLVSRGVHPTPTSVSKALGRIGKNVRWDPKASKIVYYEAAGHNLNGRETKWLRQVVGRKRTPAALKVSPHPNAGHYPVCEAVCCVEGGYLPLLVKVE